MNLNPRVYLIAIIPLFYSCGQKVPTDPQQRLEQLKIEQQKINMEIKQLEAELSISDTATVEKAKLVQIDTLRPRAFENFIEVQGIIEADQNVLASAQMPGVVTTILVKEGDVVNKGKILAILDGATIKKGIDELKTGLALANTLYEKQERLWHQNIGSEAQYLQAKNQKEQLDLKIKTLEAQLTMTYIKSPIDGTVDHVDLKLGEMASPGFAGIRVVNNKDMTIKASLSDRYIGKVKIGDKTEVYFPEQGKSLFTKIIYCSKTINPNTRSMSIEAALPDSKIHYLSNQAVKLKITTERFEKTLVISSNYIQTSVAGESYVLVAEEKDGSIYTRKKMVVPGISYNGETQILSGLEDNEKIITVGFSDLVEGQLISL